MNAKAAHAPADFVAVAVLKGAALGIVAALLSSEAHAQVPPAVRVVDTNGVDIVSRTFRATAPVLSTAGMTVDKSTRRLNYDNFNISYIIGSTSNPIRRGDNFIYPGSDGGHSVFIDYNTMNYYTASGELIVFNLGLTSDAKNRYLRIGGMASRLVKPDGEILTFYYRTVNQHFEPTSQGGGYAFHEVTVYQVKAVASSLGWMAKYEYSQAGTTQIPTLTPTKTYIINTSVDYCDPNATSCTSSNAVNWPTLNHASCTDSQGQPYICGGALGYTTPSGVSKSVNMFTATSASNPATVNFGGRTWRYLFAWGNEADAYGSSTNSIHTIRHNPDGSTVRYVSKDYYIPDRYDNDFTLYQLSTVKGYPSQPNNDSDFFQILVNGQPLNFPAKQSLDIYPNQPYLYVDELGRKTYYDYYNNNSIENSDNRSLKRVISAEATYSGGALTGGYTEYGYDSRRNVTSVSVYPKGGGTPLVTQYAYEAACTDSNYRICNKAKKVTDPKGNVTDFVYSDVHGGILSETMPADNAGVRPQVRYSYTALTPMVRSAGGGLVASTPVYRLTQTSTCRAATSANPAACVGTADEIIKTYAYNTNNLLKTSETTRSGDNSVSATTAYTYDLNGNVTSVDGPQPGSADTSYTT